MSIVGIWETTGEHVPKDPDDGFALLQKAADKNHGPAMFQIAIRQIEGTGRSLEIEKGLVLMRAASVFGSTQAQAYLGDRYEKGIGVPRELDRASGQQKGYVVLSADERANGFVRPVRTAYVHDKCGGLTTMGLALAETYARDPSFYSGTFCVGCRAHFPVGAAGEFTWDGTTDKVGT